MKIRRMNATINEFRKTENNANAEVDEEHKNETVSSKKQNCICFECL